MSKSFLLQLPDDDHQALKLAAVQARLSMHQFLLDALREKIARQSDTPHGTNAAPAVQAAEAPSPLPNDALAKANAEKAA